MYNYGIVIIVIYIKIKEMDVDFWNTKFEILQFKHEAKMYPPRVRMTVDVPNVEPRMKLLINFEGCSRDSQLDMEILFPLTSNHQLDHISSCIKENNYYWYMQGRLTLMDQSI